jgi:hypothetical protein
MPVELVPLTPSRVRVDVVEEVMTEVRPPALDELQPPPMHGRTILRRTVFEGERTRGERIAEALRTGEPL